jgi:hypothetical protein
MGTAWARHGMCELALRGRETTVYFCTLFNDAENNENHIASKNKNIDVSRNGMHLGGKCHDVILYCLVICIKGLRKAAKYIRQDTMYQHLLCAPLCPMKVNFHKRQIVSLLAVLKLQFHTLYSGTYNHSNVGYTSIILKLQFDTG